MGEEGFLDERDGAEIGDESHRDDCIHHLSIENRTRGIGHKPGRLCLSHSQHLIF